jgi:hypothetical protein
MIDPHPLLLALPLENIESSQLSAEENEYERRKFDLGMYKWKLEKEQIRDGGAKIDLARIEKTFTELHNLNVKMLRKALADHIMVMKSEKVTSSAFKMVNWIVRPLDVQEDHQYFFKAVDKMPTIPMISKSNPTSVSSFKNASIEVLNQFEQAINNDQMTLSKALLRLYRRQLH